MAATLCSYENLFGPYHPQTLRFMAEVATVYRRHGELACARALLERAVWDVGRNLGRSHEVRLRVLVMLGDLLVEQGEHERAVSVQRELLECCAERLGAAHTDTVLARKKLATILLMAAEFRSGKDIN